MVKRTTIRYHGEIWTDFAKKIREKKKEEKENLNPTSYDTRLSEEKINNTRILFLHFYMIFRDPNERENEIKELKKYFSIIFI